MRHLNENQIFQYNGSPISFQSGDSVMVNATQMAKPFGKRPAKWLELPSTKEFLKTLSTIRKSDTELVITINGGTTEKGKGTWMHEDVALEFARWLSPMFAIWCNDRIKEILVGKSTKEDYSWINPADYTRQDLADIIIESEQDLQESDRKIAERDARIKELEDKLEHERQRKTDMRFERMENAIVRLAGIVAASCGQPAGRQAVKELTLFPEEKQQLHETAGGRIKQSHAKPHYPGTYLVNDMRRALMDERGICLRSHDIFRWLRREGWISADGNTYNKPSEMAVRNGWMLPAVGNGKRNTDKSHFTPRFTESGYRTFVETVMKKGGLL